MKDLVFIGDAHLEEEGPELDAFLPEAVRLLREVAGERLGVKASGGIRRPEEALAMLWAGADRIGTSQAAGWTAALGPGAPPLEELLG